MRVLVAGGCGYIGSVLVPMLVKAGHVVTVLDRVFFGDTVTSTGAELVRADIRDVSISHFYNIDRVIDAAGLSNDPACDLDQKLTVEVNFRGAVHLAQTAHAAGVPSYTYVSSCSVYGGSPAEHPDETTDPAPLSEYARAKLASERALLRLWGDRISIPRLATVYGVSPRMRFDLAPNLMAHKLATNKPVEVWGDGLQSRPFVHVRDVARYLLDPLPGIVNVGDPKHVLTVLDLALMVACLRPQGSVTTVPSNADARSYAPSFLKVKYGGTWQPQEDMQQGIDEVVKLIEQGWLDMDECTKTVERYRHLLDAERELDNLRLNGRLL